MIKNGIILAAGRGSRMGEETRDIPKGLVTFQGKKLITYSIDMMIRSGVSNISVVVGYKGDKIIDFLSSKYKKINFCFLKNEKWDSTNSGGSLRLALEETDVSKGFILSECDLYFSKDVKFTNNETTAFVGMLANRVGSSIDKEGFLLHSNSDEALYKTVNAYCFSPSDASKIKNNISSVFDNDYYETPWYQKIKFEILYLRNEQWGEFDSKEDMLEWEAQLFSFKQTTLNEHHNEVFLNKNNYSSNKNLLIFEDNGLLWMLGKMKTKNLIPTEKTSEIILESMKESIDSNNILTLPIMCYFDGKIFLDKEQNDVWVPGSQKGVFILDGHHRYSNFDKLNGEIYVCLTNQELLTKSINRMVSDDIAIELHEKTKNTFGIQKYREVNRFLSKKFKTINRNYKNVDYKIDGGNVEMPKIEFKEFINYIKEGKKVAPIKTIYFYPKPKPKNIGWVYKKWIEN